MVMVVHGQRIVKGLPIAFNSAKKKKVVDAKGHKTKAASTEWS